MADPITLTIDGRPVQAAPGTLLIDAAKTAGIEIPAFCYYEGLTLAAACRMCLVEVEKMPKMMTACTLPVAEGMIARTDTPQVRQARKYMLEFLLTNHPLDCPVCDKGGECELQDMVFRYGVGESRYTEEKVHTPEKQFSPVVFFDAPRCILCFRCVRVCNEGLGVGALGVVNRGVVSEIAPNMGDHLDCEECGMCIDICPVGALTSGAYRYKTRPWEMTHVGTTCTHCADGCKTTLGVRRSETGMEIVRGDNRDKSGINGDFLCIKGRYAFDFANHEDRLTQPLIRKNGRLTPSTWEEAFELIGKKFAEIKQHNQNGGQAIGVIGSTRTTNEESYLLQKFARIVLQTNNIDHHRTADFPAFAAVLAGKPEATATMRDVTNAPAILLIGNNPTDQHPLLASQIRNNVRLRNARLYIVNSAEIKLTRQAASFTQIPAGGEGQFASFLAGDAAPTNDAWSELSTKLRGEKNLVIIFGSEIRGTAVASLVKFGSKIEGAKFVCLSDYANSRGAADMGLYPDLLPGYHRVADASEFREEWGNIPASPGLTLLEMIAGAKAGSLKALYVVGA